MSITSSLLMGDRGEASSRGEGSGVPREVRTPGNEAGSTLTQRSSWTAAFDARGPASAAFAARFSSFGP
ncbi:unnamed protein product [Boreogadus saida]